MNNNVILEFLNTKTLEIKELYQVYTQLAIVFTQISEGLFYTSIDFPNEIKVGTFYDENGKKVFDLKEFDNSKTKIVNVGNFSDGKCEIVNKLENNTEFKITIDKKGKVLEQEKIE